MPSIHADRLRAMIRDGGYRDGDRLPTERALAGEFAVSRTALRQVLEELEAEGLIWRHVGKGTFIGRRPRNGQAQAFFGDDVASVDAVVEIREIVEPAAARLAAERAKPADIKRMKRFLEASRHTKDLIQFNECCEELHNAIAKASHNPLIAKLYEALSPVQSLASAVGERPVYSDEEHQFYYAHHRDIVEAIIDGEPARAERLMRTHINSVGDDAHGTKGGSSHPKAADGPRAVIFLAALQSLAERFGETVFLVKQSDRPELVEAVLPSGGAGRTVVHPGAGVRPPECATSVVLAAFNGGQGAETQAIRDAGFALSDRSLEPEIYCIAAPVRFGTIEPRYAIGIIGMRSRMRKRSERDYLQALNWSVCDVAADIAATLGIEVPSVVRPQFIPS